MKYINTDLVFDLINAFSSIKSKEESVLFLQDILTASEIKNLSVRLRIAKMLINGTPHRGISRILKASTATVTKVNIWLNSKGDGFKKIISRLPIKYDLPTKVIHGPIEYHLPEVIEAGIQYVIATSQNKKSENLIKSLKDKSNIDRQLKEQFSDYYKHKSKSHVSS